VPITGARPNNYSPLRAYLLAATLMLGAVVFACSAEAQVSVRARTAEASHLGWPEITGMLLQNSNNENRPLDGRPGHDPFDGTDPSYSCDGADTGGLYHDCGFPGISDSPRFTTLPQLEAECRQEAGHAKTTPSESPTSETESAEGTSSEGSPGPKKSSLAEPEPLSRFMSPVALDASVVPLPSGLPASCAAKYEQADLVPANIGHNELLGGDGNDTIHAGSAGDVIWGDSHAEGNDRAQVDRLYGGAGDDWIYASHGTNYIWTGAGTDHVLLVYGHGVVYCNGPGRKIFVMRKLSTNRHYRLVGCSDKTIVPYAA
jgi:Ca2+-binding RTX toxin-like protein